MRRPTATLKERSVQVEGLRVHVRSSTDAAPRGQTPLVLVHGLGISGAAVLPAARRLGVYMPVIVPDLPGFGRSEAPPEPLDVAGHARALVALLDVLELERASFLGNSFGCQVVAELAATHPDRVERVVLQGPGVDRRARTAPRQVWRMLSDTLCASLGFWAVVLVSWWRAGLRRIHATGQAALAHRMEEVAPRVAAPSLVLSGSRDRIAPSSWGRELARRLPRGRHVLLDGVRHAACYDAPQAVLEAARPFLVGRSAPERVARRLPDPPAYVADVDSATSHLRAASDALRGEALGSFGARTSRAPDSRLRQRVHALTGRGGAARPEDLPRIGADALCLFAAERYPRRTYPAVLLGSSGGPAVHLATALDVPWLPQTFLVPVRRVGAADVHDLRAELTWGEAVGRRVLDAAPGLSLHHVHDPDREALASPPVSSFRLKLRRLGAAYRRFFEERLEPGATVYLLECHQRWPVVRLGPRHVFQVGAVGGLEPEDDRRGGAEAVQVPARRGAERRRWDPPEPDDEAPEAEWGFDPAVRHEVLAAADELGLRVVRLVWEHPDDPSAALAELHRAWFASLERPTDRLLVESLALTAPLEALRQGLAPFWTHGLGRHAARALARYLDAAGPFQRIDAFGGPRRAAPAGGAERRWRDLLARAPEHAVLGGELAALPRDVALHARSHQALEGRPGQRFTVPPPLAPAQLEAWLARAIGRTGGAVLEEVRPAGAARGRRRSSESWRLALY